MRHLKQVKVEFVTGNKGKYEEVKEVLSGYGIEVEHVAISKPEIDSDDLREITEYAALRLAKEMGKCVVVEDTGLYFKAFNNFPGTRPKFVMNGIGLQGVLKLLKGEDREAYFMTVAAIAWPDSRIEIFEGKVNGSISEEIRGDPHTQLPYDSLFIPEGQDKTFAEDLELKRKISHRKQAFEKLGEWYATKESSASR